MDYAEWLESLKTGSVVKFRHARRVIVAVLEKSLVIETKDEMLYFDLKTGRQQNATLSGHKAGSLMLWTLQNENDFLEAKESSEVKAKIDKVCRRLDKLLPDILEIKYNHSSNLVSRKSRLKRLLLLEKYLLKNKAKVARLR